ncbi:hypothetical protein NDU88_004419 [Pleurodeles waltl]|uniref:Uncharacterized protein n=1 Tax=Pleurodeles waltl TaxID=8319 RepID=A0AAV7TU30_PLEWA|nr:hypothetical protein NDU88_004419 [Pleurodeles waltl]
MATTTPALLLFPRCPSHGTGTTTPPPAYSLLPPLIPRQYCPYTPLGISASAKARHPPSPQQGTECARRRGQVPDTGARLNYLLAAAESGNQKMACCLEVCRLGATLELRSSRIAAERGWSRADPIAELRRRRGGARRSGSLSTKSETGEEGATAAGSLGPPGHWRGGGGPGAGPALSGPRQPGTALRSPLPPPFLPSYERSRSSAPQSGPILLGAGSAKLSRREGILSPPPLPPPWEASAASTMLPLPKRGTMLARTSSASSCRPPHTAPPPTYRTQHGAEPGYGAASRPTVLGLETSSRREGAAPVLGAHGTRSAHLRPG